MEGRSAALPRPWPSGWPSCSRPLSTRRTSCGVGCSCRGLQGGGLCGVRGTVALHCRASNIGC
uniref:Uncharacterized protein n=1 Tax=uncultured marine virus TaxID=186617 RepID=A0A0F7L6B2_9VIRU|nr:hypothetical protein [uncultured marine virus]